MDRWLEVLRPSTTCQTRAETQLRVSNESNVAGAEKWEVCRLAAGSGGAAGTHSKKVQI